MIAIAQESGRLESIGAMVARGLSFHQNGDLAGAEQVYRQILTREPENADALHLLGSVRGRQGLTAEGIRLMEQAIAVSPRVTFYHNNLGNLRAAAGDAEGAEESYRRAIQVDRANADAHLNLGKLLEGRGLKSKARECFVAALRRNPRSVEAHMSLGRLEESEGKVRGALQSYSNAVRLDPGYAAGHLAVGNAQVKLDQLDKAEASYRTALALEPEYTDAVFNLANTLLAQKRPEEAVAKYERAIQLSPQPDADIYNKYGVALDRVKRSEEAEAAHRRAIALRPRFADAYFNLGIVLYGQERAEDAVAAYERAIALSSKLRAAYYNNLGAALTACKRSEDAVAAYERAIELEPGSPDGYFNLGRELFESGKQEESVAMLQRAIALDPDHGGASLQMGVVFYAQGLLAEAVAANRKALAVTPTCPIVRRNLGQSMSHTGDAGGLVLLQDVAAELPESAEVRWSLAEHLLLHGRFEQGWREYEWRMQVENLRWQYRSFDVPTWAGEDLTGKRILIYAEQGFGDTMQFARYARLVAERGATVILEVQPGLQRWCAALPGVSECYVQKSELPAFDLVVPMMSLPYLLETRAETIPPPVMPRYEERPGDGSKLRVGMVWAGNGKHVRDRLRSTRLVEWRGLASVEGVEFTSLQVGAPAEQRKEEGHGFQFVADCQDLRDFADTAERIAGLDLVITVDTAVAHLAGSMGKPVWILLYNAVDWRWGLEGKTTPWYPTARLFRQTTPGDWSGVFGEVEAGLRELVGYPNG